MDSMNVIDYCMDIPFDKFSPITQYCICDICKKGFMTKMPFVTCHICIATQNTHYFDAIDASEYDKYVFICSCGMYHEINK